METTSHLKSSFKNSRTSQLKEEVLNIVIGLMEWRNNDCGLKQKLWKRMQVRVSNMANPINILVKAEAKKGQYNKDFHDPDDDYKLFLESREEVNKLPGSSRDFALWKHKNKLGKDYKRTVFHLCNGKD